LKMDLKLETQNDLKTLHSKGKPLKKDAVGK
jgi:hypothetical protein